MPGPTVAFLESARQVDAVLALSPLPGELIALAPTAAARLEELGHAYRKPEDFYDERELSGIAQEIMDAQAAWAAWVDNWLQARVPSFKQNGFRPARLHFFHLKVMFDALRIRAHVLNAVAKALKPSRAIAFAAGSAKVGTGLAFNESLTAACLPAWSRNGDFEASVLPAAGDERFSPTARRRPKLDPRRAASLWRRRILPALIRPLASMAPGRAVLVRPDYDVERLTEPLTRRGFFPREWSGWLASLPKRSGPQMPSLDDIAREPRWQEPLRPEGLDLSEAARSRLRAWWTDVIPAAWSTQVAAREAFRRQRFHAVVVPFAESAEDAAVLQAAKNEGIPVFVYQHGGFAGACEYPMWENLDLLFSDTMLFYGEAVAEHYRRKLERYPDKRARCIPIGSARLDALRAPRDDRARLRRLLGAEDRTPLILYFPTMHTAYRRYLCGGEYPDVSHWQLQRDILRTFKRHPSARLVYRPFEGGYESPMPGLFARELPGARIERDMPLPDLARAVDAIIADIPSTGLLEALMTDRPILVYADDRSLRMTERAKSLLRRRAWLDETPEAFLSRIDAFLKTGDFTPVKDPDRGFLREYGADADDGRSARRAVDLIVGAGRRIDTIAS